MQYGYFDDKNRTYVITNPRTPVKWINYIGTLAFGGFVDHTGGALICRNDPAQNRITRYVQQQPDSDFKGETLYLRIRREQGGYEIFSPFFVPTLVPCDRYECHVGLGYTRILSEYRGLRTEVTIFVPPDAHCELRDILVTNIGDTAVSVDVVPVVEYTHPSALMQWTNADWVPQTMVSRAVDAGTELPILVQYPFYRKDTHINFFTSNHPVRSFETDRQRFLGDNGYGGWRTPRSLEQDDLSNHEANRGDNIAALLQPLGLLAPGATRRLITQLGQADNVEAARPVIERYRDPARVDGALADLAASWNRYLAGLQAHSPDPALDHMLNVHHPRQCYITMNWSRYLSCYQLGYGARGIGFRDSSQDVLGVLAGAPEEARALTARLLRIQRPDGSAMHQVNPLTMHATRGEAGDRCGGFYGDDHLWSVLAVCAYVKETGNTAFLEQAIPFYDEDRPPSEADTGTVFDHLQRGIEFTRTHLGRHGLPLLGFADWNDCVNLPDGAESLFIANLYGAALRELAALAGYLGDTGNRERFEAYYREMQTRVNEQAWDGEWYVRYFDKDGNPLGSRDNTVGRIYANAQSWPVISGFAPAERARSALDAVYRLLNTKYGIKLSTPGYNRFDPQVGGVSTYPPGAKENGGIFLHSNPWVIIAETLLGRGTRAYEYYAQINPAAKNAMIDLYEVEPYVYAQNILGDEHPQFGLGRNSWLTGTAAWTYVAATQYILGIRPEYRGLRLDPCIPESWKGFTVTRRFRGASYHIEVSNPDRVCKGIASLELDGRELDSSLLPPAAPGSVCRVRAVMGNPG